MEIEMTFLYFASESFASRAKVLVDSIKQFHPYDKIVHIDPGSFPLGSYIPGMAKMRLIKALELLESGHKAVIIIGADCELFAPLREFTSIVYPEDILLVPHVIQPTNSREYMSQLYRTGHANADLMCFQNTDNSKNALKWLISVTEGNEPNKGIFYEQTWLSALPFLFSKVQIVRNPGINCGYWTENIDVDNLVMMQYSGFEKGKPHRMSKYYSGPDVTGDVLKLFKNYDDRITS